MKNIKNIKKLTHLITVSLLAIAIAFAPSLSFAKNGQDDNGASGRYNKQNETSSVRIGANVSANVNSGNSGRNNSGSSHENSNNDSGRSLRTVDDNNNNRNNSNQNNSNDSGFWSRLWTNWFGKKAKAANTSTSTNQKPSISGITAPTVLKTGQEGKWTVKASDPKNTSLTYMVDWGETSSTSAKSMAQAFVQTSTFTHTYDNPGTYTVKFTVQNEAGLQTQSTTTVHVMGKTTDQKTPVITSLDGPSSVEEGTEATVTIKAKDPKNDSLTYSADWGDTMTTALKANSAPVFEQTSTFSHVYDQEGTYTATFTVQNSAGLKDTETKKITVTDGDDDDDNTAPVITGNISLQIGSTSATINWTTNEASDSHAYYSTISPVDVNAGSTTHVSNDSDVTSHSVNLSGLSTSTLYHFILKSTDASGNTVTSSEFTFTTGA